MGTGISPHESTDYERDLAAARARLGEAGWHAAWAEGRAMSMGSLALQAIAYALEEG